ncbi:hypothetical protein MANY_23140 [Mycolicibacterium anyangense]|uniref:DUF2505 domain-containing protein n=1 Tax=Mycolicibacterium anyangense TaxID=1431246 RepID=A0A6N4W9W7_9MYCO|nr:DUF2505 domain-containing protein [Mycolicibacterium anyangense]BBZ76977.1 hypothetical protein MANY_23140 [Mycolicibacterium anyangense]
MAHSLDVVADSVARVEQIHEAFGREDYWLARLAGDGNATLESLRVDGDGTVAVRLTQRIIGLTGLMAKVVPGELQLSYSETWTPGGDGTVRGAVDVSAAGGLGSSLADNLLTPVGTGSQLRAVVKVKVKVPLLGGQLEKTIGSSLAGSIPSVLAFTTDWIAQHC